MLFACQYKLNHFIYVYLYVSDTTYSLIHVKKSIVPWLLDWGGWYQYGVAKSLCKGRILHTHGGNDVFVSISPWKIKRLWELL